MAAATPHTPRRRAGQGRSTSTSQTRTDATGSSVREPVPYDAAELAAGCALSEGFRRLHYQLTGLPTTLQALRGRDQRGKVAAIVAPTAAAQVTTIMRKLALVPPFLAEWQTSPSLPTAQLLCAQARHLFTDVPFTR